jgi:ABC-type uncharacterized transport system involved in gliding motility auxiliary subunit
MIKKYINYLKSPTLAICFFAGVLFTLFTLYPFRIDLSKGKAYTLADSTKKIVQSASKQIAITLYVSDDLPTRILPLKNDVVLLLQEYRRAGKNIAFGIKDPKNDQKASSRAKELGIPQLQFSQLEQNKYQTSSFYFGMGIEYDGKTEIIPQVSDYGNLEYNVTSALYRLTKKEIPSVGIVGDSSPTYAQQGGNFTVLRQTLAQQYRVTDVSLTQTDENKDDPLKGVDALFIFDDGTSKFDPAQIAMLKKYYESGKHIFVFAGGVWIDEQTLQAHVADHNINELTATYGARINSDLALSTSAEYVNFGNATMQFLTPYPFWIRTNTFNKQAGLFMNTQYLTYPWTSTLSATNSKNTKMTQLVSSSDRSWVQSKDFALNPNTIPQPTAADLKAFMLGVELENKKGGVMVIIPSSRFASDRYLSKGSGNLDFILNAVDLVSSHGALSGIRSRTASAYAISDMSEGMKNVYKYAALLSGSMLWIIYGAIRILKRQKNG